MENNKIILDLCGGTGAWSKPYKDTGYIVHNITLPEFDVLGTYPFNGIATDSLKLPSSLREHNLHFSGERRTLNIEVKRIYGILAAPPCTEFSLAKSTKPRNFAKGMEIVQKCLEIIWYVRAYNENLQWWALENPRGFLRQFLGKPAFTFEQWEFGDAGIKPTDLWGYFSEPRKLVKIRPEGLSVKYPNNRWNAKEWSGSADKRAITSAGFAQAFFKVNQ